MPQPPTPQELASRYAQATTLRTRATGTPFRVVARQERLVIIPTSGNERLVDPEEIRRAWPLIAKGATRTALKAVTNNSSYLDAIFDDLSVDRDLVASPHADLPESEPVEVVEPRLQAAELKLAETEHQLALAHAQIARFESERDREASDVDALGLTIRRLQQELLTSNSVRASLERQLEEAGAKLKYLEVRGPDVDRKLSLTIDKQVFDSDHQIRPDLWEILVEAGQLAFKSPFGSVAHSRRAIEAAVGYLWREATGNVGTPKTSDMLEDLRGHRLMPMPDWHLAKNLYGRASAIVHDGTKRPDLALWIFFGAVQICELVQPDEESG